MQIVDAQVHLWAADSPERPWPPGQAGREHRKIPLLADELLGEMDKAGVHRAVLVPPSWEGDRNDICLAAAQKHPDRLAVMGRLSLTSPESRRLIKGWKKQPGMLGLRFTFHTDKMRVWLHDGTADWLWPAAEAEGVPLMILPPGSMPEVGAIAEKHPGLRLIIDHLALTRGLDEAKTFAELPDLLKLARHPNIAVKSSCMPGYSSVPYPYHNLDKYLRQVYDAFGPERMFWGSDFSRLPCSYRQCVTHFTDELKWLTEKDKDSIMGRALCTWLNWPLKG